MKYYIVAGCAVFAALAAVFCMHMQNAPTDPHSQWKRVAVEPETKVRPARFEEMKFHPGTELRAPASTHK